MKTVAVACLLLLAAGCAHRPQADRTSAAQRAGSIGDYPPNFVPVPKDSIQR